MHKTPMQSQINDDSGSFAQVSSVKQSGSMKQRAAIIDVPLHMKTRPDQKFFFYRYHIIDPCPVDRPSLIRSIIQNLIQRKDPPFDDPSEQGKMKEYNNGQIFIKPPAGKTKKIEYKNMIWFLI